LNEPQNIDLTTENENRRPKSRKRKKAMQSNGKEIKLNCCEIQVTHKEPLKGVLKYLNRRIVPLVGLFVN